MSNKSISNVFLLCLAVIILVGAGPFFTIAILTWVIFVGFGIASLWTWGMVCGIWAILLACIIFEVVTVGIFKMIGF